MINALVRRTQRIVPVFSGKCLDGIGRNFHLVFERRQTVTFLLLLCVAENSPTTAAKPA
jgi:hypothetical protein